MNAWSSMPVLASVGVAALSLAASVVLAALVAMRWRPPALLWAAGPALTAAAAAGAVMVGLADTSAFLAEQTLLDGGGVAASWRDAMVPLGYGLVIAGVLAAAQSVLLGVAGAIGAGADARLRWSGLLAPVVAATALPVLMGALSVAGVLAGGSLLPTFVAVPGLIGLAAASLRQQDDPDHAPRTAAYASAAAAAAVTGVLFAAVGALIPQYGEILVESAFHPWQVDSARAWSQAAIAAAVPVGAVGVLAAASLLPLGPALLDGRGVVGGLGAALAWGTAAAVAAGALALGAPMLPMARHAPLESFVRDVALPHPRGLASGEALGDCGLIAKGDVLVADPALRTCADVHTPVLIPTGAMPAKALVDAVPGARRPVLLMARGDDQLGLVAFELWSVDGPWPMAVAVYDDPTGERAQIGDAEPVGLPGDPSAWGPAVLQVAQDRPIVFVPADGWNVQDVLGRCALLQRPHEPCRIGRSPHAPPDFVDHAAAPEPKGPVADGFRAGVRSQQKGLRYCYERRLKANPDLAGRIEVSLEISRGQVRSTRITSSTTKDREFDRCVADDMKGWTFDTVVDGSFSMPFTFHAR